jgi:arginine decarboxylase-like protein
MQYKTEDLLEELRIAIEKGLKKNCLSAKESAKLTTYFKQALESYTYLVV